LNLIAYLSNLFRFKTFSPEKNIAPIFLFFKIYPHRVDYAVTLEKWDKTESTILFKALIADDIIHY